MSETSWDFCGVFRCCIDALEEIAPDTDVTPGDTVECPRCGDVWTLGDDGIWSTEIQRGEKR